MSADDGSTIPLVLGFLLLGLIVVAGSVAAGDAFVQQSNLQSACDAAAVAAASHVDVDSQRAAGSGSALRLAGAEDAVRVYLERDPGRAQIEASAALDAASETVTVTCVRRQPIAFGSFFGFRTGIEHRATSSARSPESS